MKTPKMILFDYGGTLLNERNCDFLRAERELFRYVTANPRNVTPEDACKCAAEVFETFAVMRKAGFEVDECHILRVKNGLLGLEYSIPEEELADVLFRHSCDLVPTPHIGELLTYLCDHGIRTGVISNIAWLPDSLAGRICDALPESAFEFVMTSSEYGIRKPDPALFRIALNRAGLDADDVWYCGDSFTADVVGACGAGLYPVWYAHDGEKQPADFEYLHIRDWRELMDFLH